MNGFVDGSGETFHEDAAQQFVTDGVTEVAVVAVRDWYRMLRYELTEAGACVACGSLVAGL